MKCGYVAGVDEAGRGPLAGPVAVGVVRVPHGFNPAHLTGVRDSKQLSPRERARLYKVITQTPGLTWGVAMVAATVIDREGINGAIIIALTRALRKAGAEPETTLVMLDGGIKAPSSFVHQKTIVRGDQTNILIGAASIIAKVTRDRHMMRMHAQYPLYGFDRHKGYGTEFHRKRIRIQGLCPIHRKTFCHP